MPAPGVTDGLAFASAPGCGMLLATVSRPNLFMLLRAHIKRCGTTPDGRIFQTARGGIIQIRPTVSPWLDSRDHRARPGHPDPDRLVRHPLPPHPPPGPPPPCPRAPSPPLPPPAPVPLHPPDPVP